VDLPQNEFERQRIAAGQGVDGLQSVVGGLTSSPNPCAVARNG
jgi:hypothetical protein